VFTSCGGGSTVPLLEDPAATRDAALTAAATSGNTCDPAARPRGRRPRGPC